jgi:hypothetical protein
MTTATQPQPIEVTHIGTDGPSVVRIGSTEYFVWDNLSHWTVEKFSTQGGQSYRVYVAGGKARSCSCPDATYRGRICKHAHAVDAVIEAAW